MESNFKFKAFLIILVLILLTYSNSFRNQFVWDDDFLIVRNPYIRSPSSISKILSKELFFSIPVWRSYYRPLQTLSYALDYSIFRLNPWGFHLANILLHFLNALLVLKLLNLLAKDNFVALAGAILFSLHPAQVEAVTYVSGRADLLLGVFFLSSLILYIIHYNYPLPKRSHLYLTSLLLFLLSLLSRELALILPFILIAFDFFNKKIRLSRYIPYFFIAIVYLSVRLLISSVTRHSLFTFKDTIILNPIKLFKVIITYAKIVILPVNLHTGRLLPVNITLADILLLILFVSVFIICTRLYKAKKNIVYFATVWFSVILVSQTNIFWRTIIVHTAEHCLYLPLIGFFLIISFLIKRVYERNRPRAITLFIGLVLFYGIITYSQNIFWKDSISLYRWTLKNSPGNFLIRYNLGLEYVKKNLFEQAIKEFKLVLKYNPEYTDALSSLGNVYFELGRYKDANELYQRALKIDPNSAFLRQNYEMISKELKGYNDK